MSLGPSRLGTAVATAEGGLREQRTWRERLRLCPWTPEGRPLLSAMIPVLGSSEGWQGQLSHGLVLRTPCMRQAAGR